MRKTKKKTEKYINLPRFCGAHWKFVWIISKKLKVRFDGFCTSLINECGPALNHDVSYATNKSLFLHFEAKLKMSDKIICKVNFSDGSYCKYHFQIFVF